MEIKRVVEPELEENTYIVTNGNDCVIVDPGSDSEKILQEIHKLILGKRLRGVIYTHCHYDHIRGGRFFNVDQYMSEEDIALMPQFSEQARAFYGIKFQEPTNLKVLPKKLTLGSITFDVLHTPGHTLGSVCLAIKTADKFENTLLTGDTLFKGTYGRTDLGGNDIQMRSSLKLLANLSSKTKIYPGHGSSSTINNELYWLKQLS